MAVAGLHLLLLPNWDLLVVQLLVRASLLVLHVLGHQVVQVGLGLGLYHMSAYAASTLDVRTYAKR